MLARATKAPATTGRPGEGVLPSAPHKGGSMICNRRTFFAAASGLAVGVRMAAATAQGASDRIRVGVIGTGGRARGLMGLLKKLPGNEMVAVCDVYEPRPAAGGRDRRPDGRTGRRLPAHPGRPDHRRRRHRHAGPLAQDHHARCRGRRQGRLCREAGVAHSRGRGRDGEGDRGVEPDRADRHPAAQLGSLPAREGDHRLGQPRSDYARAHLLVPARDRRELPGRRHGHSSTGNAGWGRRRTSRSVRSVSSSGATSGISAAAA